MTRITVLAVGVLLLGGNAIAQQSQAQSILAPVVASGAEVVVHLDGEPPSLRGRLLSAADQLVLVDSDGVEHPFALEKVDRIERIGDSVADGALIGAAILGGLCVWTCRQGSTSPEHQRRLVIGNIVIGAILGGVYDHGRQGKTTIYTRGQRASIGFAVSPRSVSVAIKF